MKHKVENIDETSEEKIVLRRQGWVTRAEIGERQTKFKKWRRIKQGRSG